MIRRLLVLPATVALALSAYGCRGTQRTAAPSPTAPASPSPSPTRTGPCPPSTGGVQTQAYLTDVRLGTHERFDRITFEFKPAQGAPPGVPAYEVKKTSPPFTRAPSDERSDVSGAFHTGVIFHGGTGVEIVPETPIEHYKGDKELKPGFEVIVEAEQLSDFEATLQWVVGTFRDSCAKATVESDPPRLVLDFPH